VSTMRQVAERAGVSAKTVSRVINNDRYVSDDVRQRVEQAIAELNYVPNALARTFRSGRDTTIGVAVPDISDPFFATLTRAIEEVARLRGVAVVVTSLGDDPDNERPGVEALLSRQITGLISTPTSATQSYLKPWRDRTPMVFIDREPAKLTADSVVEDDVGGAYAATRHLIEHGHRRIGFLGAPVSIATTPRRLHGYRTALAEADITEDPKLVSLVTDDDQASKAVLEQLGLEQPPTALFSSNARCSISIIPVLQSIDRSDIALVGFGDFPLAASLQPALTVLDQDPIAVGRTAATRLFDRIDHPNRRLKRKTVLPVQLVQRGSCGCSSQPVQP
jgi:LacI family transcriptional regulator